MNYLNRLAIFMLEHKQLIMLCVLATSLVCSVVYSWGPPFDGDGDYD